MSTTDTTRSLDAVELDQLVATYAPIGERRKRKKNRQRALKTGCAAAVATAASLFAYSDISLMQSVSDLMPTASSALRDSDLAMLDKERVEFAAKIAELERQIVGIQSKEHALESTQADLDEQSALLAQLLDKTGSEQTLLERRQQQGSQLDQEIAAITAQRMALEKRWAQFEAQGELLAMEIIAVNAQRKELEVQRRQIDLQRRELTEMLKQADDLTSRNTRSASTESTRDESLAAADDSFTYTNNSLVVDNSELDDMRGGFSIGDGLDVSFGYTQTGAVNGVEQYSNSFSIGSMASGFEDIDMSNMNSVLLQNGSGNFASASVLDSLSESFGNIIQNTLDDQLISTTTIYDISLHNVPGTLQGLAGEQALMDSIGSYR